MAAYTTLKMVPADHQALQALLQFLAGRIDIAGFRVVLLSQGRRVENIPDDRLVADMAGLLLNAVA